MDADRCLSTKAIFLLVCILFRIYTSNNGKVGLVRTLLILTHYPPFFIDLTTLVVFFLA